MGAVTRVATYCFLMFTQRSVYHSHIEQYLAGIAYLVKFSKRIVEFIVVVAG